MRKPLPKCGSCASWTPAHERASNPTVRHALAPCINAHSDAPAEPRKYHLGYALTRRNHVCAMYSKARV